MSDKQVNILIFDEDNNFINTFEKNIYRQKTLNNNVHIQIDHINNVKSINSKDIKYNYDLYLINQNIDNDAKVSDIVRHIRDINFSSKIFITSDSSDFRLLSKLCNIGIHGFVDKQNIDYQNIATAINQINNTKESIHKLQAKMSNIDRIREFATNALGESVRTKTA